MANQRKAGQVLVAVWMDQDFLAALDEARKKEHLDRSLFVRKCIAEELKRLGIPFDPLHVWPPERAKGKRTPIVAEEKGRRALSQAREALKVGH